MKLKFLIMSVIIIILNLICYYFNNRLLHPMTNVCFTLAGINYIFINIKHKNLK